MSFTKNPYYTRTSRGVMISFVYQWGTEGAPTATSIVGVPFKGCQFNLDVGSLNIPAALNFGEIRTMQITHMTDIGPAGVISNKFNTPLIIGVEDTGQYFAVGMNPFVPIANANTSPGSSYVTACVPIVAQNPTKIIFGLAEDVANNYENTPLTVVHLFTYDLPAFVLQGYSTSPLSLA